MMKRVFLSGATAVLAAGSVTAAILAIVPAEAHVSDSVTHLWGTHIKSKGDTRWESIGTIRQFGQVRMDADDPDVTLATAGPFRLESRCSQNATTTSASIEFVTTEEHSSYRSTGDYDEDFNPGEGANWGQTSGLNSETTPGAADEQGHALAPSGWAIDGRSAIWTQFDGHDCVFAGYLMVLARP